jgi:hypothetical protein
MIKPGRNRAFIRPNSGFPHDRFLAGVREGGGWRRFHLMRCPYGVEGVATGGVQAPSGIVVITRVANCTLSCEKSTFQPLNPQFFSLQSGELHS